MIIITYGHQKCLKLSTIYFFENDYSNSTNTMKYIVLMLTKSYHDYILFNHISLPYKYI